MALQVLGSARDIRTNTHVVYAKVSIPDYLALVGDDFADFQIQRRREKYKAYQRLRADIQQGALLPSITLAVKAHFVDGFIGLIEARDNAALESTLARPSQVNILDGLQRTYILKDLQTDGIEFPEDQTLLVEFWFEPHIRNLIYRIIVLNAGQKPMSLRHQVELLFLTIREQLQTQIPDLEVFTEREGTRRTRSRKYALDDVATAYQSFLSGSPEVQRENIVAQSLVEESILEESEEALGEKFERFRGYLLHYAEIDDEVYRIYPVRTEEIPTSATWFGTDNVMNSFFAAVASFATSPEREQRIQVAIRNLKERLRAAEPESDPLGLATLHRLRLGFNVKRVNVGFATRKLMTAAFKEFFRESGEVSLEQCWRSEAE
jgi:hypothetical protein